MSGVPAGVHLFDSDLPAGWLAAATTTKIVAWDVETSGLDWRTERLGTCQVLVPPLGVAIVKVSADRPVHLIELLETSAVTKVFHHAPFDLRFMVHEWGATPHSIRCTKVASKVLAPGAENSAHSLKHLLSGVLGVSIQKGTVRTSDWTASSLSAAQLEYAAGDVQHLIPLWDSLMSEAHERGQAELVTRCCDFLPTRVALDLGGYPDVFAY